MNLIINNTYLKQGLLKVEILGRGMTWLDAGTYDFAITLKDAENYIKEITARVEKTNKEKNPLNNTTENKNEEKTEIKKENIPHNRRRRVVVDSISCV